MARPVLRDQQADFRGGLNLAADEDALAPNELRRADECVLTEFGAVTKRAGTQRISTAALGSSVQNGFAWLRDNGTQQLLAVAGGTLRTASYGMPTTWTTQSGSLESATTPAFAAFRSGATEVTYIADGASATSLNKWNGTALTTNIVSTPAGITQLAVYNQRLFGVRGSDQLIYWSGLNDGDSLGVAGGGGGQAVIRTFGDQNIVGLAAMRSSLLIFHVSGISRFTGLTQDDIAIAAGAQGVTTDVGAIAPRSIVTTPDAVFFLSDRGFYAADEGKVVPISLKLDPLMRQLDLAQSQGVIGVHRRALREVWWFLPDVGVYRYNYALNAWTGPCLGGYLAPATTALWEAQDDSAQPIVLAGDASGWVKLCDAPGVTRDNAPAVGGGGTSYAMAVRCRRLFHSEPMAFKAYKWIYLQAWLKASNAASVTWQTSTASGVYSIPNPGAPFGEWGSGAWGGGTWGAGAARPIRVPINGYGQYIDILLTDGGDAQSVWSRVEVDGFDYGRRY